jgi:chemotaxis protein CheD
VTSALAVPGVALLPREIVRRHRIYLPPSQVVACAEPAEIVTVLGSCVAVCIWDKARRAGGMNHFVLAEGREREGTFQLAEPALHRLLELMASLGSRRQNLVAKVFGGACVLRAFNTGRHLGTKNADAARSLLQREGIPVIGADTGGARGRKIVFHTDDGNVWLRLI